MGQVDVQWMVSEYNSDLGKKYSNVFFKIQANAPKIASVPKIVKRPSSLCSGGFTYMEMRYLKVSFNDGRVLQYPVGDLGDLKDIVQLLMPSILDDKIPGNGADEAACIDLVGEKWTFVPSIFLKNKYINKPYKEIPVRSLKETGMFEYTSDVAGSMMMPYSLETGTSGDSKTLLECQKKGLSNAQEGASACVGASGIKVRHFQIEALAEKDTNSILPNGKKYSKVSRKAPVSKIGQVISVADDVATCAYCLKYYGESIPNVHLYFKQALLDPNWTPSFIP